MGAEERGLAQEVGAFPVERDNLVDALIYCDMTVSAEGEPVSVNGRIAEVLDRCGPTSVVGRFMLRAEQDLRDATAGSRLACPEQEASGRFITGESLNRCTARSGSR
jgi:hypothetical protein